MKTVSINPDHVSNSPPDFEFEELLLESIDDGLSILGDSTKQAVYVCLQKTTESKNRTFPTKSRGSRTPSNRYSDLEPNSSKSK